ncbi:AI-2E family transporter [Flavobacterium sp. JP2137]|uniref:AI-2E family transporter n=1 Tax=Flavobacterium sp. JP2137 TaxID=3414510 RepID=UPI003D30068D
MRLKFEYPFYLKLACVLISIVVLGYLGIVGQNVIVPIVLGLLFATLLVPFCSFLERKCRFPRALAAIVATVLFTGLIVLVLYLLAMQMTKLADDWPAFQQQLIDSFSSLQLWVQEQFGIEQNSQLDYITQTASKSISTGTDILGKALSSISGVIMLLVFTFLYTLFLLLYRRHLVKFLVLAFRDKHQHLVLDVVVQVQVMVKRYLVGLLLQMVIVTVLALIAYSIIGVKYNFMLAILTGVLNVLPYIGIFMALVIGVIITFATTSASHVLFVVIAIVVIHAIDGNLIMPKVVGSKVKLNSLVVILGLVIGEMTWGISGMLLTIPILAILKIVFDRVEDLRPWGFLLGEEDNESPLFNKAITKIFKNQEKAGEDDNCPDDSPPTP